MLGCEYKRTVIPCECYLRVYPYTDSFVRDLEDVKKELEDSGKVGKVELIQEEWHEYDNELSDNFLDLCLNVAINRILSNDRIFDYSHNHDYFNWSVTTVDNLNNINHIDGDNIGFLIEVCSNPKYSEVNINSINISNEIIETMANVANEIRLSKRIKMGLGTAGIELEVKQ